MKRAAVLTLALTLALVGLSACGASQDEMAGAGSTQPQLSAEAVTDFQCGEIELHEEILPWEFEEGEMENPYYKRTVNEAGEPVYAVLKASNHQPAYLGIGETVLYSGNYDTCYFERTTYTFDTPHG